MKMPFYITIVLCSLLFGCNKEQHQSSDQLTGNWLLTEVYDKNTSSALPRPAGGDVVISFRTDHSFEGHTLRNTFNAGSYTITGTDKVTFGTYNTTKVLEDSWGGSFHTVLNACMLQSVAPCAANEFTIQGDLLKIQTPLRYNITLTRQ
jgi:hypothetical protein